MVGGFYAAGYSPEDILSIMMHADLFNIFSLKFHQGIFSMHSFEKIYHKYIPHDSFEGLNMPLYVAATDILQGETIYFSSGPLAMALMATSCVPVAFQPVLYQGREYFDGGILNNLPIEPLESICDLLIAVNVNSIDRNVETIPTKDLIDRSFHLALSKSIEEKAAKCDLFIEPPAMSRFGMFDIYEMDQIFEAGYNHVMSIKDDLKVFQEKYAN